MLFGFFWQNTWPKKPACEPYPLTINHKINMKETVHFGNHVPGHGEGQRLAGNIEKAHGKIQ